MTSCHKLCEWVVLTRLYQLLPIIRFCASSDISFSKRPSDALLSRTYLCVHAPSSSIMMPSSGAILNRVKDAWQRLSRYLNQQRVRFSLSCPLPCSPLPVPPLIPVSYTHLRAHETGR